MRRCPTHGVREDECGECEALIDRAEDARDPAWADASGWRVGQDAYERDLQRRGVL